MPSTTTFNYEMKSHEAQAGEYGEESRITQVRHIWRKDLAAYQIDTDSLTAENEGALPRRGDLGYASGTGITWQQFVRFRGYTVRMLPNGTGAEYTLTWTTRYALTLHGASPPTLYYALKGGVSFASQNRSIRLYRTGWTTNPPAALDTTAADIGGTNLQGGQDAPAVMVSQNRFRVTLEQDSTVVTMQAAAVQVSSYQNYTNSASFMGFTARSVLCEGVHVNPVKDEFYEVSFDFLYDPFFHHEQVPLLDTDGRPLRNNNGVSDVRWKRYPYQTVDFNLIYGGSTPLKDLTERGYGLP
jgi:hypothetical protein